MSQQYRAHTVFKSELEHEVQVQSSKCLYFVWINEDEAQVRGPGVREEGELPHTGGKMDSEDFAILLIVLFENGLWPGD